MVSVTRASGIPFLAAITYTTQWPFCESCSSEFKRVALRTKLFGIYPAALLAAVALFVAVREINTGAENGIALSILLAAVIVGVLGTATPMLVQRLKPLSDGRISNFPSIRPIKGGKGLVSGKMALVVEFKNPCYAQAFAAANDPENVSHKEAALKAMEEWQLKKKPVEAHDQPQDDGNS